MNRLFRSKAHQEIRQQALKARQSAGAPRPARAAGGPLRRLIERLRIKV